MLHVGCRGMPRSGVVVSISAYNIYTSSIGGVWIPCNKPNLSTLARCQTSESMQGVNNIVKLLFSRAPVYKAKIGLILFTF